MKILLINPPRIMPLGLEGHNGLGGHGLTFIAAGLMAEHDVAIYDAAAEVWNEGKAASGGNYVGAGFDEIGRRILSAGPDMVVIKVSSMENLKSALLVAMTAKSVDRGIVTVLGGPNPTIWPAEAVSHPAVNFVVIDEPRRTMPELARTIEERNLAQLEEVKGIAYKRDGKAVLTAPRPPLRATVGFVGV